MIAPPPRRQQLLAWKCCNTGRATLECLAQANTGSLLHGSQRLDLTFHIGRRLIRRYDDMSDFLIAAEMPEGAGQDSDTSTFYLQSERNCRKLRGWAQRKAPCHGETPGGAPKPPRRSPSIGSSIEERRRQSPEPINKFTQRHTLRYSGLEDGSRPVDLFDRRNIRQRIQSARDRANISESSNLERR